MTMIARSMSYSSAKSSPAVYYAGYDPGSRIAMLCGDVMQWGSRWEGDCGVAGFRGCGVTRLRSRGFHLGTPQPSNPATNFSRHRVH